MYVRRVEESPAELAKCNEFLRQFHKVSAPIPTPEIERQLAQHLPALPRPITVAAYENKTIRGVVTCWAPIALVAASTKRQGSAHASKIAAEWRALTFMAVDGRHQRKGIGRKLVDLLESECRESGALNIFGFAEDLPSPSWPFYSELGYTIHPPGKLLLIGGNSYGQSSGRKGRLFSKSI